MRADLLLGDEELVQLVHDGHQQAVESGNARDNPGPPPYKTIMYQETGIGRTLQGIYAGKFIAHLDCYAWVQRDSYLPLGSRGLKAVTRYKLKYDPVEIDPELMTPYCQERPQEMAEYSVSDAVATYYLFMK